MFSPFIQKAHISCNRCLGTIWQHLLPFLSLRPASFLGLQMDETTVSERQGQSNLTPPDAASDCLNNQLRSTGSKKKKNMAAGLRIANIDLNKPRGYWNYAIWTDETQAEMFVHKTQQHIWCISAQTPQNICKAWQKKGNDLGLFCSQ